MSSSVLLTGAPHPTFLDAIGKLTKKIDLSRAEMRLLMKNTMSGEFSVAQIAAIIVALRVKGETVDEIVGAVEIMRELVTEVDLGTEKIVDLCGTGGDGASTFNISTAAMFVVAAAGIKVAKHGGRAVSSTTGSADLLEGFGANINLTADEVRNCVENTGIGFMFAPNHHPSMRHVAPIRRDLGVRTMFNILGPLTNPARVKRQLMGVFDKNLLKPLAEVLKILGSEHVLLVHGANGLDEISLEGSTYYAELKENKITEGILNPENFGIFETETVNVFESIKIKDLEESKKMVYKSLSFSGGSAQLVVALNAAAAIYVGGGAFTLKEGFMKAMETIKSGAARETLEQFVRYTSSIQKK
jgi:anthranilate phosphoribosyltransferase